MSIGDQMPNVALELLFIICSFPTMIRFDTNLLADAILEAPGWARVGITAPSSSMREDAARELAQAIIDRVATPVSEGETNQAALPL